jgi:hypothetical protein
MPRKHPIIVTELLQKSQEAATTAVEVYNKPSTQFRTGTYCCLMIIAWTSLFHTIFAKRKRSYFHKEGRRFRRIDGDKVAWELSNCVREYWGPDTGDAVRKNLELFIKLRNKIEHRSMRAIDSTLLPEAQSLLLNFKEMLLTEFGIAFLEDFGLYVPISVLTAPVRIPRTRDEASVLAFIEAYRASLDASVWEDTKYAFRAFLVPKIGNHQNSSDVSIEFVNSRELSEDQLRNMRGLTALIRDRHAEMRPDMLKPGGVVKAVKRRHRTFNMATFVRAWKHFGVRPAANAPNKADTDRRYCQYDPVDGDYRYDPAFARKICDHLDAGEPL